jgi:hypothetical protein
MKFKHFKELKYINPEDYIYKGSENIILEIKNKVTSSKNRIKNYSDNEDIESLIHIFIQGWTMAFLNFLLILSVIIGFPIHFIVRLIKLIIQNNDYYSIIVFPFVIIYEILTSFQAWCSLYNAENFIMSDKEKTEYYLKFKKSDEYVIWYTFWR